MWGFILGFCGLNVRLDLSVDIFVRGGKRLLNPCWITQLFLYAPKFLLLQTSIQPVLDPSRISRRTATEQCPQYHSMQHQLLLAFSQLPDE